MRIAILSIHSSPLGRAGSKDTGGMSIYLRGLSLALGSRGHRVDLYTRKAGSAEDTVQQVGPGVRLICPGDALGELDKNRLYAHCPAVAESIDRFMLREQLEYDVIFSHYWLSGVAGTILKQRRQVPHVIMFHTLGRAKNESCPGENEPQLRLEKEAELARDCDLIVAAAGLEKKRLQEYYSLSFDKVAIVPSGIDRSSFYPYEPKERLEAKIEAGSSKAAKTILAVGRLEPVKGFELLLEAVSLLPAEDNYEVVIIGGEGKNEARLASLQEKARALGLGGRVSFKGVIEHERLPLYYNAADITVIPSYYESFGLAALESVACGTPVAGSPVGVLPELVGGNCAFGVLVEGRDPAAWAAAIRRVSGLKPISGKALEDALAPYSWPEAASRLEAVLSAL